MEKGKQFISRRLDENNKRFINAIFNKNADGTDRKKSEVDPKLIAEGLDMAKKDK